MDGLKSNKWKGKDGACSFCGKLVSEHPDWVLPDRVAKYCNGKETNHERIRNENTGEAS